MKASLELPGVLRIRHLVWTVEYVPAEEAESGEYYGVCLGSSLKIKVKENLLPRLQAEIVLHECIHAMRFSEAQRGSDDSMTEEEMATWLPVALAQLFNDNPEFADWWNEYRKI